MSPKMVFHEVFPRERVLSMILPKSVLGQLTRKHQLLQYPLEDSKCKQVMNILKKIVLNMKDVKIKKCIIIKATPCTHSSDKVTSFFVV